MNSGYFKTQDYTTLHYRVTGVGQNNIIILHGGLGDSREMSIIIDNLDQEYFRLIQMDFRGHGRSYHGEKNLDYNLYADDVFALMDELKIETASVVGYSDGATTGLVMAYKQPDRIKTVVAISPDTGIAGWTEGTNLDHTFEELASIEEMRADYQSISPEPEKFHQLLKRVKALWQSEIHLEIEKLKDIKAFCWIVGSESDEFIKKEDLDLIQKKIPNSDKYLFFDLKHGELAPSVAELSIGNDHVLTSILKG
ncbi:MAG: alpha/beta hydrolase [Ignavibacteriales bacterium]|nr:MAG: alpha/beta hydrolase [Ignavibacteriaceae bacterium]MBW7873238.1 alpha/beta hydrolase [Ignavibacteria bacterium]MCZ2142976.1 alpha/beta hydrolase [Ignavibacteriales bacterium]OQY73118.1 MAG: hypothetical protein B6D45_08385 [Ignavibacteriales bacterium UTCHB3]MBV6444663.1 putative aminoacrylate hydrolase RutD [Ignavibacteriaceae bacterium]